MKSYRCILEFWTENKYFSSSPVAVALVIPGQYLLTAHGAPALFVGRHVPHMNSEVQDS